jgi:hypothetical protein
MKTHRNKLPVLNLMQLLFGIICLNLLVLDFFLVKSYITGTSVLGESTVAESCPTSCIDKFSQYVSRTNQTAGETFVPLGSGSGYSNDWSDVTGALATIDTSKFNRIKKVTFEATLQDPTGNQTVWVRLFNVTDKHPVWYSEVSMDGTGPILLTSQPITLDSGNKTYQVQLKTQLGYAASLTQSRIHIITY